MPTNHAAYLVADKAPLEIREAPYYTPGPNEVVIKNFAVGLNPIDGYCQYTPVWPMQYPAILGFDCAGTIAEIGSNVTRFKIGDRVIYAGGSAMGDNNVGAFQEYALGPSNLVSPIPDSLSFEAAAVLPIAISTAACGLYEADQLKMPLPSLSPKATGKTVLVWGGASSVGMAAIQLAKASGYEVITTASSKNFEIMRQLGASDMYDYKTSSVVQDLIKAFKGKDFAGAIICGGSEPDTSKVVGEVAAGIDGGNKFLACCLGHFKTDGLPEGVDGKFVFGKSCMHNHIGDAIFKDYLPEALSTGKFLPVPEPDVVARGLHDMQKGVDARFQREVSAKKMVVVL